MFTYIPSHYNRGFPYHTFDFIIIYGPDATISTPTGTLPSNVWARIMENLPAFAAGCESLRMEGMKTFRISRAE